MAERPPTEAPEGCDETCRNAVEYGWHKPFPTPAPPAGPLLGEKARQHALIAVGVNGGSSSAAVQLREEIDTEKVDLVLDALAPHVAALVAAAEQRGAERERERIVTMLREWSTDADRSADKQVAAGRVNVAVIDRQEAEDLLRAAGRIAGVEDR